MPMVASAPPPRTHSWSFVYFKSAGYIRCSLRGPLVERHRHDLRGHAAAADVDLEGLPGLRRRRRDVGHADRALEERRLRAAGDLAGVDAVDDHRTAAAGDAAVDHLEADDAPGHAGRLLRVERRLADEI